jgi:glutamate synthase (ferredoxin)
MCVVLCAACSAGPAWLVGERDACGVGFIANADAKSSHKIIAAGLRALGCMEHRGACLSDNVSGDGSGIMTAIPWKLLEQQGAFGLTAGPKPLPARHLRGLGMMFLPRDAAKAQRCRDVIAEEFGKDGMKFNGWRTVPVDDSPLGPEGRANQPVIEQFMITSTTSLVRLIVKSSLHSNTALYYEDCFSAV